MLSCDSEVFFSGTGFSIGVSTGVVSLCKRFGLAAIIGVSGATTGVVSRFGSAAMVGVSSATTGIVSTIGVYVTGVDGASTGTADYIAAFFFSSRSAFSSFSCCIFSRRISYGDFLATYDVLFYGDFSESLSALPPGRYGPRPDTVFLRVSRPSLAIYI